MRQPYATINDFIILFPDSRAEERRLRLCLLMASEKIDEITFGRIIGRGIEKLTPFQQEKVKLATLLQTQYLLDKEDSGGIDMADVSSFSVLDISVALDKDSKQNTKEIHPGMSNDAYGVINKTGLTNRGMSRRWWRGGLRS
jgi:hypothetical protein